MYSEERFHEFEKQILQNTERYDSEHPNGEKARTLLITAVELSNIQDHVHRNYVDVIDERQANLFDDTVREYEFRGQI
jgi:hypothetical protein